MEILISESGNTLLTQSVTRIGVNIPVLTGSRYAVGKAMIASLTEGTKGVSAGGTDAHGGVGLDHHSHAAAHAGAIHNICHQIQTGLQQKTVVARKFIFTHKKFHLSSHEQGPKAFIQVSKQTHFTHVTIFLMISAEFDHLHKFNHVLIHKTQTHNVLNSSINSFIYVV